MICPLRGCGDLAGLSGAPLRAVIITRPGTFVLLSGKPVEYRKTADSGNVRLQAFCPGCGTAIYATSTDDEPKLYNGALERFVPGLINSVRKATHAARPTRWSSTSASGTVDAHLR